ncbi:hypothetical protein [Streptomyces mirabilis]|uniref:hypothetical protein n=1 Tax=Streptomyces mirabilis TaxID=68239 RepID=UPI0036DA36F8
MLAVLRHDQRLADMAGGNGVGESTVRRWVKEVVRLLAARSTHLDRALKKIARSGGVVVLLDGTLIRTHRRTEKDDRKNYSPIWPKEFFLYGHPALRMRARRCAPGTRPQVCTFCCEIRIRRLDEYVWARQVVE